jgi:hypothetical protein
MPIIILALISSTFLYSITNTSFYRNLLSNFAHNFGQLAIYINSSSIDLDKKIELTQQKSLAMLRDMFFISLIFLIFSYLSKLLIILSYKYSIATILSFVFIYLSFVKSRKFKKGEIELIGNFSSSMKLFHYLFMEFHNLQIPFKNLQSFIFRNPPKPKNAVFVTGLARSGTTALLQELSKIETFKSFTYRTMPFLLAPKLWTMLNFGSNLSHSRVHKDNIKINIDSPESFDEYFWKLILKNSYLTHGFLKIHNISENDMKSFEHFVSQILGSKDTYLSKNNNLVLRLCDIIKLRPNYEILVVFRNPIEQAKSLQRQHKLFIKKQQEDPFITHYMNWLGHHEFGKNRKEFSLKSSSFNYKNPDQLNFWLERWCIYYDYVLNVAGNFVKFVSNKQIYENPSFVVEKILKKKGAHVNDLKENIRYNENEAIDSKLFRESRNLFKLMKYKEI